MRKKVPRKRSKVLFPPKSAVPHQHLASSTRRSAQRTSAFERAEFQDSDVRAGRKLALVAHAQMLIRPGVPSLFSERALLRDDLSTKTSTVQDATVDDCLDLLAGLEPGKTEEEYTSTGVPHLERENHVDFLKEHLEDAGHVGYDPARPWIVYWCLNGLCLLGEDVLEYRQRVIETFKPAQNTTGGFGGSHGHLSHIASSYAAVLSLAIVGGQEAYELIDRRALWKWFGRVKESDGGFRMCEGGEEDVRGLYCTLVMIALLALPLELPPDAPARRAGHTTFTDGVPEYISRCQTYEGGISGAPQTEAHGAYAFCVLGSLCILGEPHEMIPKHLDLSLLISWLSARQYAPEGGFSGRTNKLVDGCYSHWVGGCWPLIEAALEVQHPHGPLRGRGLYSRGGLTRYILSCCQSDLGGLRDKPSAYPDAYHSCYVLAGLSSTQYDNTFTTDAGITTTNGLDAAFQWKQVRRHTNEGSEERSTFGEGDRVEACHPVLAIPSSAVAAAHGYFHSKMGF